MSGEHERGESKGQFCGIPGQPCKCPSPHDYIEVCRPGWANVTFPRLVKAKGGAFTFDKKYEAHHILCVSPIATQIVAKPEISEIVENTRWCINNKDNMLAMPLWGHTVMWYCSILATGGSIKTTLAPPPFVNIPQHDWDHNCTGGYTDEVKEAVTSLAESIEENKETHKVSTKNVVDKLNSLSTRFRNELSLRGLRDGGTHVGWEAGMRDSKSAWYAPYSMASSAFLTAKGFPVKDFDTRSAKWIQRIAAAIAGA